MPYKRKIARKQVQAPAFHQIITAFYRDQISHDDFRKAVQDLDHDSMIETLPNGQGHIMVILFLFKKELIQYVKQNPGCSEAEARQLVENKVLFMMQTLIGRAQILNVQARLLVNTDINANTALLRAAQTTGEIFWLYFMNLQLLVNSEVIDEETYASFLILANKKGLTPLSVLGSNHELTYLKNYLTEVQRVSTFFPNGISDYLQLLTKENHCGQSPLHTLLNSPIPGVVETYLNELQFVVYILGYMTEASYIRLLTQSDKNGFTPLHVVFNRTGDLTNGLAYLNEIMLAIKQKQIPSRFFTRINEYEETFIHRAMKAPKLEYVQACFMILDGLRAAECLSLADVQALLSNLDATQPINALSNHGFTPLHQLAIYSESLDAVTWFCTKLKTYRLSPLQIYDLFHYVSDFARQPESSNPDINSHLDAERYNAWLRLYGSCQTHEDLTRLFEERPSARMYYNALPMATSSSSSSYPQASPSGFFFQSHPASPVAGGSYSVPAVAPVSLPACSDHQTHSSALPTPAIQGHRSHAPHARSVASTSSGHSASSSGHSQRARFHKPVKREQRPHDQHEGRDHTAGRTPKRSRFGGHG